MGWDMYGLIAYRAAGAPPVRVIEGVPFRAVYAAEGATLRAALSARAAARQLRRAGVHLAAFPADYPHRAVFARYGVGAPSAAPLYRACAPAIVRRCLAQRGVDPRGAVVVFAAEYVTPELTRCVEALCAEVRYVVLAVPHGGDALAQTLRRRYGVAAPVVSPDTAPRAALTVVFDETPAGGGALRLDETLRVTFNSPHPPEVLSLLWRAGALDAATLEVKAVTPGDVDG